MENVELNTIPIEEYTEQQYFFDKGVKAGASELLQLFTNGDNEIYVSGVVTGIQAMIQLVTVQGLSPQEACEACMQHSIVQLPG